MLTTLWFSSSSCPLSWSGKYQGHLHCFLFHVILLYCFCLSGLTKICFQFLYFPQPLEKLPCRYFLISMRLSHMVGFRRCHGISAVADNSIKEDCKQSCFSRYICDDHHNLSFKIWWSWQFWWFSQFWLKLQSTILFIVCLVYLS